MSKEKKAQSPLEILVIVSSILAIAAYFLQNPLFFHISGIICAVLVIFVAITLAVTTPKGLGFLKYLYLRRTVPSDWLADCQEPLGRVAAGAGHDGYCDICRLCHSPSFQFTLP